MCDWSIANLCWNLKKKHIALTFANLHTFHEASRSVSERCHTTANWVNYTRYFWNKRTENVRVDISRKTVPLLLHQSTSAQVTRKAKVKGSIARLTYWNSLCLTEQTHFSTHGLHQGFFFLHNKVQHIQYWIQRSVVEQVTESLSLGTFGPEELFHSDKCCTKYLFFIVSALQELRTTYYHSSSNTFWWTF